MFVELLILGKEKNTNSEEVIDKLCSETNKKNFLRQSFKIFALFDRGSSKKQSLKFLTYF